MKKKKGIHKSSHRRKKTPLLEIKPPKIWNEKKVVYINSIMGKILHIRLVLNIIVPHGAGNETQYPLPPPLNDSIELFKLDSSHPAFHPEYVFFFTLYYLLFL